MRGLAFSFILMAACSVGGLDFAGHSVTSIQVGANNVVTGQIGEHVVFSAVQPAPPSPYAAVSGGTVTYYTEADVNYEIHTFTVTDTLTVSRGGLIDAVLVVAGGGGGSAGGGGAGGLIYATDYVVGVGDMPVEVGLGGAGNMSTYEGDPGVGPQGYDGGNSSFGIYTAIGGGGGGANAIVGTGRSGGSGGGAGNAGQQDLGGTGTPGQGYDGGFNDPTPEQYPAGGGGGAGGAGGTPVDAGTGGTGGPGVAYTISGAEVWYAGGGGGGVYIGGNDGAGGSGIGGTGSGALGTPGGNGVPGTGSGGGGGVAAGYSSAGGSGGSGIVIIKVRAP